MRLFSDQVTEINNWYLISHFPLNAFLIRLWRYYGTSRIDRIIEYVSMSIVGHIGLNGGHDNVTVKIHKFFVPELLYLLTKFDFPSTLIETIRTNTWVGKADQFAGPYQTDISQIAHQMNVTLYGYQKTFVENYERCKLRNCLYGHILSFEQGLGKTVTALATMCAMRKSLVIVIAPKSTLETVWLQHITTFFKRERKVCINGRDGLTTDCEFLLVNYEGLEKLEALLPKLAKLGTKLGIIVDESHNFLRTAANRTKQLIHLREASKCQDMLLMSGTPIKALGIEILPMLLILDQFMDEDAYEIFKRAFGLNISLATDVLRERLSRMMHRKTKDEVLHLPDKTEQTINLEIPNAYKYTISTIKTEALKFARERLRYHQAHMHEYVSIFEATLRYLERVVPNKAQFRQYQQDIADIRSRPVTTYNPKDANLIQRCNRYELEVLLPLLPTDMRKAFVNVKAAVKYLHLKIQGEVIGQYLTHQRIKLTSEMVLHAGLPDLINTAIKKTVVFTSYVDTIEVTDRYLRQAGYHTVLVYGKTSNEIVSAVDRFTHDRKINPLIASIQTMATGVTLTAASTMIMLNKPWRWVDYDQAVARIHRIGQTTPVTIYTIVLDTGEEPNLSTRMEDIMDWSKTCFDLIVNGKEA